MDAADLRQLLAGRYSSPEWFLTFEVPIREGDGGRRIDVLAVSRIASRGHEVHAIEIKVNRSDWAAELKNPAKAEGWGSAADRFYVATPKGLVAPIELPAGWGLYEPAAGGLHEVVPSLLNPWRESGRDPVDRRMWVFLLRRALDGDESTVKVLTQKAYEDGRKYGELQGRESGKFKEESARRALAELQADVAEYEKASGVKVVGWEHIGFGSGPEERGWAVRRLIAGKRAEDRLNNIRNSVQGLLDDIDEAIAGKRKNDRGGING
jgi:hypothetical protein